MNAITCTQALISSVSSFFFSYVLLLNEQCSNARSHNIYDAQIKLGDDVRVSPCQSIDLTTEPLKYKRSFGVAEPSP